MGFFIKKRPYDADDIQHHVYQVRRVPKVPHIKEDMSSNKQSAISKIIGFVGKKELAVLALAGYSYLGYNNNFLPFPWHHQPESGSIIQVEPTKSHSSDLPTLERISETADQKQIDFAKELAGSDGILDGKERDAACQTAAQQGSKKVEATNEAIKLIAKKKVPGVRASSWNLKGCSEAVAK